MTDTTLFCPRCGGYTMDCIAVTHTTTDPDTGNELYRCRLCGYREVITTPKLAHDQNE